MDIDFLDLKSIYPESTSYVVHKYTKHDQNHLQISNIVSYDSNQDKKSTPLMNYSELNEPINKLDSSTLPSESHKTKQGIYPFHHIDHDQLFQYEVLLLRGLHYRSDLWFSSTHEQITPPPPIIVISADPNLEIHLPILINNEILIIERGQCFINQNNCLNLFIDAIPFNLTEEEINTNNLNLDLFFTLNSFHNIKVNKISCDPQKIKYINRLSAFAQKFGRRTIIRLCNDHKELSKIILKVRCLLSYLYNIKFKSNFKYNKDQIDYTINPLETKHKIINQLLKFPTLLEKENKFIYSVFNNNPNVSLKLKNQYLIKLINKLQSRDKFEIFKYEHYELNQIKSQESISILISFYYQCFLTLKPEFIYLNIINGSEISFENYSNDLKRDVLLNENKNNGKEINYEKDLKNYELFNNERIINKKVINELYLKIISFQKLIYLNPNLKFIAKLFIFPLHSISKHYYHSSVESGIARVKMKIDQHMKKGLKSLSWHHISISDHNDKVVFKFILFSNRNKFNKIIVVNKKNYNSFLSRLIRRNNKPFSPSFICKMNLISFTITINNDLNLFYQKLRKRINFHLIQLYPLKQETIHLYIGKYRTLTNLKLWGRFSEKLSTWLINFSQIIFNLLKQSKISYLYKAIRRNIKPFSPSCFCQSNNLFVLKLKILMYLVHKIVLFLKIFSTNNFLVGQIHKLLRINIRYIQFMIMFRSLFEFILNIGFTFKWIVVPLSGNTISIYH